MDWLCFGIYRYSFGIEFVLCGYCFGGVLVLHWYCVGIGIGMMLVVDWLCLGTHRYKYCFE